MTAWAVPRLYRRAILVYFLAIVAPVAAFVWLGIQTVAAQRAIILEQAQKEAAQELAAATEAAAKAAFSLPEHPIVGDRFEMRGGVVVWPALHAPITDNPPDDFLDAYRR